MTDIPKFITPEWLKKHPECIFVFGDNLQRWGKGGAAKNRDESNAYGFITKKAPNNNDDSFYKPGEYTEVCTQELGLLVAQIMINTDKTFLISKLGGGLANRYNIFEKVIAPKIEWLANKFDNVILLP